MAVKVGAAIWSGSGGAALDTVAGVETGETGWIVLSAGTVSEAGFVWLEGGMGCCCDPLESRGCSWRKVESLSDWVALEVGTVGVAVRVGSLAK